jgi:hypothetical protein
LDRPVIILGAARSGTTLIARVLGASDEVFLITEIAPHLKPRHCPEDRSGVSDAELWRDHFAFKSWRTDKKRPVCERPIFDEAKLASMRDLYLQMAGDKRLVIKNPRGIARVDMLKTMFPDALFLFSLRGPWPTIQSATIKGNTSFLLPTDFVNSLPHNLILRAAATWAESIDVLMRERDSNWLVVRHEELVAKPHGVVAELYKRANITHAPLAHAARLPERRARDYGFIKYQMMRHPYRDETFSLLAERAHAVGYDANLSALGGSGLRYAAGTWLGQLRLSKQSKSLPKQTAFLAHSPRALV